MPTITECTFPVELQPMDAVDAAASERAEWLLSSPDPPPPWRQLYTSVKETVLPRGGSTCQPRAHKWPRLFLEAVFPILKWGRNYKATKFKNDLMAGLTLASLCIPQVNIYLFSLFIFLKIEMECSFLFIFILFGRVLDMLIWQGLNLSMAYVSIYNVIIKLILCFFFFFLTIYICI